MLLGKIRDAYNKEFKGWFLGVENVRMYSTVRGSDVCHGLSAKVHQFLSICTLFEGAF